ncbi:Rid family hydrolase [Tropicimonas sp. IMCC34011]|uniref:Rid family hydrolase n=1 Tax=Tropicimonas sp. IMCC34011 TaxID=2248759 RepID=UPI000E229B19|nr:Rid family hydrolase [Tropicimonas sp. IMCC34011]
MTDMKDRIFTGAPAEDFAGFAKAVIDGRHVHVSGTLGQDADGTLPEGVAEQLKNAIASVAATLEQAGGRSVRLPQCGRRELQGAMPAGALPDDRSLRRPRAAAARLRFHLGGGGTAAV